MWRFADGGVHLHSVPQHADEVEKLGLVKLHHINLSSPLVPKMDEFYRNVLGLDELQGGTASNRMMSTDG